ncbi:MAG: LysR family transcriptional regulator [Pontibacterium sp.]
MELYHLRTFVKVADTGNLTRASEALFTSQPAISGHIKALEDELGLRLFSRSAKGMSLTPAGKSLYAQAQATLDAAQAFKFAAQALKNELVGELKVGVHTDFDFVRTGHLYANMHARHPKVPVHFLQGSSYITNGQLRDGQIDIGFMFGENHANDVEMYLVEEVPMAIVAPAKWADKIEGADLAKLAQQPWVYTSSSCPFFVLMESVFSDCPVKVRQHAWVDSEDAVRQLVKSGVGLSVLRLDDAQRMAALGEVAIWEGDVPSIPMSIATLKRRKGEPVIDAFKQLVFETWQIDQVAASA